MFRADRRSALVAACLFALACAGQPHGAATRVIIPRGASFAQAADSLARTGLVGSPRMFRLYGRLTGGDRNIKPGTYLLKHGTPWKDIVSALNGGHGLVNTITIPEGYSLSQITPLLARTLKVPADSVEAAVRDTALLARLDIPNKTVEGYVFPDTYAFPLGTTARQATREMVYAFERRWRPDWDSSLGGLKINRNCLDFHQARVPIGSPAALECIDHLARGLPRRGSEWERVRIWKDIAFDRLIRDVESCQQCGVANGGFHRISRHFERSCQKRRDLREAVTLGDRDRVDEPVPAIERADDVLPRRTMLQEIRTGLDVAISAGESTVQSEHPRRTNEPRPRQRVCRLCEAGAAGNDHARRRSVRLTRARKRKQTRRDERGAPISSE